MSDPIVEKVLVEVGGYRDLEEPVILTSGEIGIYYINTEKLVQDNNGWQNYADDSFGMIKHSVKMMEMHRSFEQVVERLAEEIEKLFPADIPKERRFISGGQRRDWVFSGPVARVLGLAHVSLHKDGSAYLIDAAFKDIKALSYQSQPLKGGYVVHIADLLTKASSAYNLATNPPSGWIVYLKKLGAQIEDLVAVVTRLQGGEESMQAIGIRTKSFVQIDNQFIERNSRDSQRALEYMRNPRAWSEKFLKNCDITKFTEYFNPLGSKLDRAQKFLALFRDVLKESGQLDKLKAAVKKQYEAEIL